MSGEPTPTLIRTRPGMRLAAFDVGGTDTKIALVDDTGLGPIRRIPTPRPADSDGAGALESMIIAESEAMAADAVSLVVPGIVDDVAGIIRFAANLGIHHHPLRDRLISRIGLPVVVGHDIAAAGIAERTFGAARGVDNVLIMPIGTGIAAVAFVDGHRLRGGGYAGELGHTQVPGGGRCRCGAYGCLETVASAAAIARRYVAASGREVAGAEEVARRLGADPIADQVWDEALAAIAYALGHAVAILGSELIVLSGGLAGAGPTLLDPLAAKLDARSSWQRRPRLIVGTLGQDAGLWGAATLGLALPGVA